VEDTVDGGNAQVRIEHLSGKILNHEALQLFQVQAGLRLEQHLQVLNVIRVKVLR
jgi:hypothetical protein